MTGSDADSRPGRPDHGVPAIDEVAMEARIGGILYRRPAVGLAVGVVRNGSLEFFHGHGFADIASHAPVTEDTVFRIGSITKTFTAIAVMQLWEQGLVDLDALANDCLRAYRLIPAKAAHRPATVRHLLTHTSGLPQLVYPSRVFKPILGETVAFGQRVPTLAEFYRGGLHLVAEPGTRLTYSNHNFATLGQIIEDVTGEPLARYFREHIFDPLGMADTDLIRSDQVQALLATGYALRSDGPRPVGDCDVIAFGAGAVYSTTSDMARYVAALLGGGSNKHGSVLKPGTLASMFAPQYQPDPRVPGVGLAFFRHDIGGHLVVEHNGLVPGFSSEIRGARRRRRCPGVHQRCERRQSVARGRSLGSAAADPRRPGRSHPHRYPAPPRDMERRLRLVRLPRLTPRCAEVVHRGGGGLCSPRPAHTSTPHPDTCTVPQLSPAPR